jgi:hypothetical protein
MFDVLHLEVIEGLAHKLNHHLLTQLYRERDDDLIPIRDLFIARGLSQILSRLVEEFPGSPKDYLLSIVLDTIHDESQTDTQFEPRTTDSPSLEGLTGSELLEAMISLVCGPIPEAEEATGDEALCELVNLLTILRYITTPFAVFDSFDIKELQESLTQPVICVKYREIVETIYWANVKVQEALVDLGMTLWGLTRARLDKAKRKLREQAVKDLHTEQPFSRPCIAGMCQRAIETVE